MEGPREDNKILRYYFGEFPLPYPFKQTEDKIYRWVKAKLTKKPRIKKLKSQKQFESLQKKKLTPIFKFPQDDKVFKSRMKNFATLFSGTVFYVVTTEIEGIEEEP